jgi:hypothetical protein
MFGVLGILFSIFPYVLASLFNLSSPKSRSIQMTHIEKTHPRWEAMWENGIEKGQLFDKGSPSPALVHHINSGLIPNGRALVPGMVIIITLFSLCKIIGNYKLLPLRSSYNRVEAMMLPLWPQPIDL